MTKRRRSAVTMYAIAARDGDQLRLVARIARRKSGVYYVTPRDDADFGIVSRVPWNPHTSYHADGRHHVKAHGAVRGPRYKRQPITEQFREAEDLMSQSFGPRDLWHEQTRCEPAEFSEVFELPMEAISPEDFIQLRTALCAPGQSAMWAPPSSAELARHYFRDQVPWVEVTVWRVSV